MGWFLVYIFLISYILQLTWSTYLVNPYISHGTHGTSDFTLLPSSFQYTYPSPVYERYYHDHNSYYDRNYNDKDYTYPLSQSVREGEYDTHVEDGDDEYTEEYDDGYTYDDHEQGVEDNSVDLGHSETPMSHAARMLMYGHQPQMYGYSQQQPVVHHNPYGYHDMDMKKTKKKKKHKDYEMDDYDDHHDSDDDDHYEDDHYPKKMKKRKRKKKYYKPKKKKKVKKVYVPIVIKKKKKKKRKTIAVYKGFYIPGGLQIFGKFKKMKDCKKACEITPNCFAADYNPWLKKCYVHTNVTACNNMRTHPKLIHFKKVPCDLLETPRGLIILGVRIHGGLEQKGVKNLQDCIKKCASAGQGIAPNTMPEEVAKQICFGIDYDFATHKCYFHTDETLCPDVDPIPTPVQTVEAPSNILILLCKFIWFLDCLTFNSSL